MFLKTHAQFKLSIFLSILFISGCISSANYLKRADNYSLKSEKYFQNAVKEYKAALVTAKDKEEIHYKLAELYFQNGKYALAIEELKNLKAQASQKLLAISYYLSADFTSALSLFNKIGIIEDDEYLYYYGLTCEQHNLFDEALKVYANIKSPGYKEMAKERISAINSLSSLNLPPEMEKLIKDAPGAEAYPQAGAVVLFAKENVEILPDGTAVFTEHFAIKIFNDRGRRDFSEVDIGYDSTYEKVELEYARTIKPDGTVVSVGDKHIRDVSRYLNFPLYSNARAMIISMPDVTDGCVIEYKARILRSQLINKKDFMINYVLQEREPIIYADFSIVIPEGRKLNSKILNEQYNKFKAKLSPDISSADKKTTYRWEFKDIPEIIPEANMPPLAEITPVIMLSTFNSWDEVYKWWWDLARDKIGVDDEIRQKVKDLLKDKSSDEEKISAIYDFCSRWIRYVAVEYGQAGYEPHRAVDIFKNKYGDCKDKAILLISMLKEAGIKAWPILIGTRDALNLEKDFPTVAFNHAIAAVKIKDQWIFLDATAETTSFGDLPPDDQDRSVLAFFEDGYKILDTPLFSSERNYVNYAVSIKINEDDSVYVDKKVSSGGVYDQSQRGWVRYTKPILIEESLKQKVQAFTPGGKLLKYKIENADNSNKPIELSYTFSGPDYLTRAGDARILPQLGSIDTSIVAKENRDYPIDFGLPNFIESRIEFQIPPNLKIKYIPGSVKFENQFLIFVNEYSVKDNKLVFLEKEAVKQRYISVEQYSAFKKFLEEAARAINQRAILEKTAAQK